MAQRTSDRHGFQALGLAVLAALALGAAPPARPADDRPLFGPVALHVVPNDFAMQAFGAFMAPRTGPFAGLAVVYAGEHEAVRAWILEGVLTQREDRIACGAATLAANAAQSPGTAPFASLGSLLAGHHFNCWAIQDITRVRRLPREWLTLVKDGEPVLKGDIETEIYGRVLAVAAATSPEAFLKAGRTDVTFPHLATDPGFYRGEVIRIEGHLRRVIRLQPTPEASLEGVSDIYEAWVFPEQMGAQAYCVVFTDWPAGLSRDYLGEKGRPKIKDNIPVRFAGYFFKNFRYRAADFKGQADRTAPMLVGNSLVFPKPGDTPPGKPNVAAWVKPLVYAVPAMLGALIFAVVGLTYWLRRSDLELQKRLLKARNSEFVPPPPDAVPVAAPVSAPAPAPAAKPARQAFPNRSTLPPRSGRQGGSSEESGPGEAGGKSPGEDAGV